MPATNAARKHVHDHRQIGEAQAKADVGDTCCLYARGTWLVRAPDVGADAESECPAASATGGKPEIYHSDQGIHYAAPAYVALLQQYGVQVSMAAKGCPRREWLHGTVDAHDQSRTLTIPPSV
jgi:transposase InsO family protein